MADMEVMAQADNLEFQTIDDVLNYIQINLKAPKNQFNKFGGYKYRNCEDIFEGLKDVLVPNAHVTVTDEIVIVGERYYIKATATLRWNGNVISNVAFAREPKEKKGMDESQVTGSTSSYARKYALNGLFMIDDVRDADADEKRDDKKETKNEERKPEEPKDDILKPFSQEELEILLNSIEGAPTAEDLDFCKGNARAAWKRMTRFQQDVVTKAIEEKVNLLTGENNNEQ